MQITIVLLALIAAGEVCAAVASVCVVVGALKVPEVAEKLAARLMARANAVRAAREIYAESRKWVLRLDPPGEDKPADPVA